jgi:Histidine kinase
MITQLNLPTYPSDNLLVQHKWMLHVLFWILIFALYFIDYRDSRGGDHHDILLPFCLASLNTGLGMFIAYPHYGLATYLLEKKQIPFWNKHYNEESVKLKLWAFEIKSPAFISHKKFEFNEVFFVYFVLTTALISWNAYIFANWGNDLYTRVHNYKLSIGLAGLDPKFFPNPKNPRGGLSFSSNIPEATTIMYLFMGILYAIKHHKLYIDSQIERKRNHLQIMTLGWQLEPHFLLSSLNTIYSAIRVQKYGKAQEIAMYLTRMINYIVRDSNFYKTNQNGKILDTGELNRVRLYEPENEDDDNWMDEVKFIKKFIELKILEKGHEAQRIQFELDNNTVNTIKGLEITPLILIGYVENAFKHGLDIDKQGEIKIRLWIDTIKNKEILRFSVWNKSSIPDTANINKIEQQTHIGMEAAKSLLKEAYSEEPIIKDNIPNEFQVELLIPIAKLKNKTA